MFSNLSPPEWCEKWLNRDCWSDELRQILNRSDKKVSVIQEVICLLGRDSSLKSKKHRLLQLNREGRDF